MSGICFNTHTHTHRRHNVHHLKASLEADRLGTSRILPLTDILKDTPMPHAEYLHLDPMSIKVYKLYLYPTASEMAGEMACEHV